MNYYNMNHGLPIYQYAPPMITSIYPAPPIFISNTYPIVQVPSTPRIPIKQQNNILYSHKWSDLLCKSDLEILIPRSSGKITMAKLYGYPEWEPITREWYACVDWVEKENNKSFSKGEYLNKRIPLYQILEINLGNRQLHVITKKLKKKSNEWYIH